MFILLICSSPKLTSVSQKYHDAPEAVPAQDPEVLNLKRADETAIMEVKVRARRLGDMKASSFWLILGLVCILVIAVTIGGAVGGSIAARKDHQGVVVQQSFSAR